MALKDPKYKKEEVSQKVNLKDAFDVDFTGHEDLRTQIGQALIDRVVERTQSGKDVRGRDFKGPYSREYKDSGEYQDFKTSSKVNMTLRGDMLDDINIISQSSNTVKIGFTDEKETLKAYNHNKGDTVPKRQFFGIQKSDLKYIKKEFRLELKELEKKKKPKKQTIGDLVKEAGLLEGFFGE